MFGFQRLANRHSWDFSTVEKMPMATVALSGEMFPARDDISDVYKPLMRFFPEADRAVHPDAHGLEIISTWKGLSIAQAHEVAFWENVFQRTLENAVRDALLTEFERSIQFLGSPTPPNAAHEFYAYINRLEDKEFYFLPSDLIRSMIDCHGVAGPQHTWLYSASYFEFFQHLLHFLGTRECFKSNGSQCTVTVLHIRAHPPKMTIQGEYMVNVMGKVLWEPLRTVFPDLPSSVEVGNSCRISPVIEAPDFVEFTGASAQYATVCKHKLVSGDFDVFWNHVTNSFEGIVPSYSSRKPWLGEWTVKESAGMQRLEFRIMSVYEDLFPGGVRLERELQSRIAINASERLEPSPVLASPALTRLDTMSRRLCKADSVVSSPRESGFSPTLANHWHGSRRLGTVRSIPKNASPITASGSTATENVPNPKASLRSHSPRSLRGLYVAAPTLQSPFRTVHRKTRLRQPGPVPVSESFSLNRFFRRENDTSLEESGTAPTDPPDDSIPTFDHHFKNRIRKDFPTLASTRGDSAFGPSKPPMSPSKRQTSWVASYDNTPASKVGQTSQLESEGLLRSTSPLKRMRADEQFIDIDRKQGTVRRREHRPLAPASNRQNRLEGIVRRVVKDELHSLATVPQPIITSRGENAPPARDPLEGDLDTGCPELPPLDFLETSAGEGLIDSQAPASAASNLTGMDLDVHDPEQGRYIDTRFQFQDILPDSPSSSSQGGNPLMRRDSGGGTFPDIGLGPPVLPLQHVGSGPELSPVVDKRIAAAQRRIGENYDEAFARTTFRNVNGYGLDDDNYDDEIANAFLCDPDDSDGADDAQMLDEDDLLLCAEEGISE